MESLKIDSVHHTSANISWNYTKDLDKFEDIEKFQLIVSNMDNKTEKTFSIDRYGGFKIYNT